ncbi:MAG: ABC transporter ATP-binding protein [Spirochaetes bacterium]|nr:ABC transporter ATP-binding protein [Spirochaetota bacterium]
MKTPSEKSAISIRNLDFAFNPGKPVFKNLNLEVSGENSPAAILGASGCGKTTLLKLIAGLLTPGAGDIAAGAASMVFQESRLLPWKTALENICLPITEKLGKKEAQEVARHFLEQVSLSHKADSLPKELSGGEQQRVNLARAFSCPADILLMDEPFQSLDIPLRIKLMDLSLSLLENYPRLAVIVSHEPREAVYLAQRVLVFGQSGQGIIHDEKIDLARRDRRYGSFAMGEIEQRLLEKLGYVQ